LILVSEHNQPDILQLEDKTKKRKIDTGIKASIGILVPAPFDTDTASIKPLIPALIPVSAAPVRLLPVLLYLIPVSTALIPVPAAAVIPQ
jgi:hypothetical protein